jgi:putative ABC transport system permease protein
MKYGRFFSDQENLHHLPVVVIGEDVQKQLMPNLDPVGKWISVDGHQLEVTGVMDRPAAYMPGMNDTRVLVPYYTMRKMFPNLREHVLMVVAYPGMVPKAQDEVRAVLRIERRDAFSAPDSFYVTTSEQMIEQFHTVTATVALVMMIVSSIGLLVGGIGVMNIMLVGVTERTREIGVRKAVGARRADIILQFLTEAMMVSLIGGSIGILAGVALPWSVSLFTDIRIPISPVAIVVAFGVSCIVGLIFGMLPANRAARLNPTEALRYE